MDKDYPADNVTESPKAPQQLPRVRRKRKDRYRLLKLLGQGGSGAVYKAEDLELDRLIAIKLLHPMLASDERYVDLLKREVVVASQITHPNIVRVYDVGQLRSSPIITMAFIQGENLASILNREGALSTPRVLHFLQQICSGLEEAHRRGIVHRDLKPQNLLVDHDGNLFISDFGLAYIASESQHLIESSHRPGTLRYMSPEQFHVLPLDSRSDIFSLGLILYEMLSGIALEVDHEATGQIAVDSKTGLPASLPDTVSGPLSAITLRCLCRNTAERYQSVSQILGCLPNVSATVNGHTASETRSEKPGANSSAGWRWGRTARRALGVALGFLLPLFAGLWSYWHLHKASSSLSFDHLYREATSELAKDDAHSVHQAVTLFEAAAALRPAEAAYEGLARAQLRLFELGNDRQRLADARSAMQKAEKLNQSSRTATLLDAEIELADGAPAIAISRLNRVLLSEPPSDEVLRLLAKAQLLAGHSSEALKIGQQAVDLNPGYWRNHNSFGNLLMALGQSEKAQVQFREVIQLNPNSHVGYANLGAAYVSSGQFERAIPVTEKSLSIRPTAAQYNNLGTALYYSGNNHAALELFRKAVELNPGSELFVGNLAEAYRRTGDNENATAAYGNALRLAQDAHRENPDDPRLTARLAIIFAKLGHMDDGQRLLASALAASPENPEILYAKAVMCVIRNQYSEGASAAKAALAHGYSIEVAARDPELTPLWADSELKMRFQAQISRELRSRADNGPW